MWSLNQLTEEKACNIGRGFVIKHRRGKSRFPFTIGFDYDILDMFEISEHKYKKAHHDYVGKAAADVSMNTIKPKFAGHNPLEPEDGGL
jgi:hypothetical protein